MGSTKWSKKKGVQCAVCDLWIDSENDNTTPTHKPKSDILGKDCRGSNKKPKASKGFPGKIYPNAVPWSKRKK